MGNHLHQAESILITVEIRSLEESAETLRDTCLKFCKECRKYTIGGFTLLFMPCNQIFMVRVMGLLFLLRCIKSGELANGEHNLFA